MKRSAVPIGIVLGTVLTASASLAQGNAPPVDVSVATFVRAESNHMIRANMDASGLEFGEPTHVRHPTTPENQPVIRMNPDTFYSSTVPDLSRPGTIILPETNGRYLFRHAATCLCT